jgi:hypothetical protein
MASCSSSARSWSFFFHKRFLTPLELALLDSDSAQLPLRGLVEGMAQLTIVTLLLEQAEFELLRVLDGTGKRKWLIALLYLQRHILVHPDGWAAIMIQQYSNTSMNLSIGIVFLLAKGHILLTSIQFIS